MADPLPVDLDAAQALTEGLAPGPWAALPTHEIYGNPPPEFDYQWTWGVVESGEDDPPIMETVFAGRETAEFLAAARSLVPALIAELRAARSQLAAERARALSDFADELDELANADEPVHYEHCSLVEAAYLARARASTQPGTQQ